MPIPGFEPFARLVGVAGLVEEVRVHLQRRGRSLLYRRFGSWFCPAGLPLGSECGTIRGEMGDREQEENGGNGIETGGELQHRVEEMEQEVRTTRREVEELREEVREVREEVREEARERPTSEPSESAEDSGIETGPEP